MTAAASKRPRKPQEIKMKAVADLRPHLNNPRTHSPGQVDQIARSITEFGWTNPILVQGRDIIAGHGRLEAARQLGMLEVPTVDLAHLTAAQRRAYVIADNKLAVNAGWNDELLRLELGGLQSLDFDLTLIGFDEVELDTLLSGEGLGDGGDAPTQIAPEIWAVIVECDDEADQVDLIQRLQEEGRKVRGSVG